MRTNVATFTVAPVFSLPWQGYFVCLLLGFSLSFLFFIDQNITSAIVNNPQNKSVYFLLEFLKTLVVLSLKKTWKVQNML